MPSTYALDTEDSVTINKLKAPQPWVRFSTDHVRCFCNLPQCVTTGYMCKSSAGSCFSNFQDHFSQQQQLLQHTKAEYKGKHGCIELLSDREQQASCDKEIKIGKDFNMNRKLIDNKRKNSLMFCCYHDMCNHIDSPQTRNIINNSSSTLLELPEYQNVRQSSISTSSSSINYYSDSQIWFRAATIAVPICGAFILFGLIILAIKILRNENRNTTNQKLGSFYGRHNKIYDNTTTPIKKNYNICQYHNDELNKVHVPLLIQNEIVATHQPHLHLHYPNHQGEKNMTNAKLNMMQYDSKQSIILDIEKEIPKCSENNLIRHTPHTKDEKYCNINKYNSDDSKSSPL